MKTCGPQLKKYTAQKRHGLQSRLAWALVLALMTGASTAARASLVLATCRAASNSSQKFSAVALAAPFPAGAVLLRPRHAPGMYISVAGSSTSGGARLVLGACSSGTAAQNAVCDFGISRSVVGWGP